MKNKTVYKTMVFIAFVYSWNLISLKPVRAAYPIIATAKMQNEKVSPYKELPPNTQLAVKKLNPADEQNTRKKEDTGIYGILAFVMGLMGIFPAAIVFGIMGLQKNRKLKGLAITGLVLGLLPLIILLFFLGFFVPVL